MTGQGDAWDEWWNRLRPVDSGAMTAESRLDLARCLAVFLDLADDAALWREAADLASKARIVAVAKLQQPRNGP